jgi:1,4-dihydroxy-2-naphthoyl-CoA hydrolase
MQRARIGGPWPGTIHESLGIAVLEASAERVVLEMPVGPRVLQPFGLLHGGASAGIELNISHLKGKREGIVRAVSIPLRKGRRIHVWTVELSDEEGDAVAAARCTLAIRSGASG